MLIFEASSLCPHGRMVQYSLPHHILAIHKLIEGECFLYPVIIKWFYSPLRSYSPFVID